MKIGLVRHFKVDTDYPENVDLLAYNSWVKIYDQLDVIENPVDLRGESFDTCYTSNLKRAYTTAETIYSGDITRTDSIKEVDLSFVEEVGGKRSVVEWGRMSTENWKENNGISREKIEDSETRVVEFLDRILEEDKNILIVAHELIITVLYRELLERGFAGESALGAENGRLYLLEK